MITKNMHEFLQQYISKESAFAEWIAVMGTLLLGTLALFGDQMRKRLFMPKLESVEIIKTRQQIEQENFIYQRLIVKNVGSSGAKKVRILLTYRREPPQNFIPVPLAWTHWRGAGRDISRQESAYIDILRKKLVFDYPVDYKYEFCWPFDTGTPYEQMLREFNPAYGDLRLELYDQDRKVGDITLRFSVDEDILKIER